MCVAKHTINHRVWKFDPLFTSAAFDVIRRHIIVYAFDHFKFKISNYVFIKEIDVFLYRNLKISRYLYSYSVVTFYAIFLFYFIIKRISNAMNVE